MRRRGLLNNKKGDGASTLTWAVGAFIIFIILIGLLLAVFFLAGKAKFKFWTPDTLKAEKIQPDVNFVSAETLDFLMGMKIEFDGQETEVKELMRKWPSIFADDDKNDALKKKLEQEIKPVLDDVLENSTGMEGYIFHAELEIVQKERAEQLQKQAGRLRKATMTAAGGALKPTENMLKGTLEVYNFKNIGCMGNKDGMLSKKAAKTYLISGEEKIEVKLYIGVC